MIFWFAVCDLLSCAIIHGFARESVRELDYLRRKGLPRRRQGDLHRASDEPSLSESFVSTNFKKELDGAKWHPYGVFGEVKVRANRNRAVQSPTNPHAPLFSFRTV